jgi:hypothetical protein
VLLPGLHEAFFAATVELATAEALDENAARTKDLTANSTVALPQEQAELISAVCAVCGAVIGLPVKLWENRHRDRVHGQGPFFLLLLLAWLLDLNLWLFFFCFLLDLWLLFCHDEHP